MKKFTLIAATVASVSAFAGDHSITATGRMGWNYNDNDIKKTGTSNDSKIAADYGKVKFAGSLNKETKYVLTTNLTQAAIASTSRYDGTNDFIDELYITRNLMEGLNLTLGKQVPLFGTVEFSHDEVDLYLKSGFWNEASGIVKNRFGATLAKEVAGQTFSLAMFNGNLNNNATKQSKYGYAVQWLGSLANGMIKPNVGYTVDRTTRIGGDNTYLGAGLQFNLPASIVFEADYGLQTQKKAATNADKKLSSIVGNLSYTGFETVTPFAKVVLDTKKDQSNGSKTYDKTGIAAGLEYKASKEDAIRYHVVYQNETTTYASNAIGLANGLLANNAKTSAQSIMVGAKFEANILK
jgi:hypothetical protein